MVGGDTEEIEGADSKAGLCVNASSEMFTKLSYY